jgi:hypothetical protein
MPAAGSLGKFSVCISVANRQFNTQISLHRGSIGGGMTSIDSVSPTIICMSTASRDILPGPNRIRLDSFDQPGTSMTFTELLWFGNLDIAVSIRNSPLLNLMPGVTVAVGLVDDNEVETKLLTGIDGFAVAPSWPNFPLNRIAFVTAFRADGFWACQSLLKVTLGSLGCYALQPSAGSRIDNNDLSLGSAAGWTGNISFFQNDWQFRVVLHTEDLNTTKVRSLRALAPDFDLSFCVVADPAGDAIGSLSRAIATPVGAKTFTVRYRYATNAGGGSGDNLIDGYSVRGVLLLA